MFTLFLAWINAKYKHDYELLFVGTIIIDIATIDVFIQLVDKI